MLSILNLCKRPCFYREEEEPANTNLDEVDMDWFMEAVWPIMAHRAPAFETLKVYIYELNNIITHIRSQKCSPYYVHTDGQTK